MYEIRFHGRGGQGAVTAANILAVAAFKAGKYSQSFPFFGVERRGAPVMAFTRIDWDRIGSRARYTSRMSLLY
jgi:pyruvate ferredoxin oxidoreductase gamma subunit